VKTENLSVVIVQHLKPDSDCAIKITDHWEWSLLHLQLHWCN